MRYHREWLSRIGREDEAALFLFLVAVGSRYAIGDPTCAHANTLFFNAQQQAKSFGILATGLKATYVMVCLLKFTITLTHQDDLLVSFSEREG